MILQKFSYVSTKAEDKVCCITATPDGKGSAFRPSLLPWASFVSLIGRTHFTLLDDKKDSSGKGIFGPGFVGSKFKMIFKGPNNPSLSPHRNLYLAVNDSIDNDNSMAFKVSIWVMRNGKVIPEDQMIKK